MPVNAVIFDMDGLLFDSERVYIELYKEQEPRFGISLSEQVYIDCIGTTWQRTREIIVEHVGDNRFDYDTFRKAVDQALDRRRLDTGLPLRPGAREIIEAFHRRGLPLGIASSSSRRVVDENLQHAALAGYFSALTGGDEIERGKPEPDIYLKTAAALEVRPEAVLAFEDSEAGIRAASGAGMRVVAVPDLKRPPDDTLALACLVCDSLTEVPGRLEELLA